jgi:predicted TIM-barrel fold metal-dependent hydrolase
MKTSWRPSYSPPLLSQAESRGPRGRRAVDAHVHIFPPEIVRARELYLERDERFRTLYSSPKARLATAEDVLAHMNGSRIELSMVFGFAFKDQGLCREVNDYVLETVQANPGRLAGMACVSPRAEGARAELERCLDAGMRGCGELTPASGDEAEIASFAAIAGCLRERGLPLLVHCSEPVGREYAGKGRFTPEACLKLARAYPGLTLIFSHLGGGLFLYELMPEVRASLTYALYDTAAVPFLYDPFVYEVVVSVIGAGRLLFGTDYPLLPAKRYRQSLHRLPSRQRAAILGGNAKRVFGL